MKLKLYIKLRMNFIFLIAQRKYILNHINIIRNIRFKYTWICEEFLIICIYVYITIIKPVQGIWKILPATFRERVTVVTSEQYRERIIYEGI